MDPYIRLLDALGAFPASGLFLVGEVTQCGGGRPLKLSAGGLPLELDDLFIEPGLNWTWTQDNGSASFLRKGDRVVLLSTDMQTYYLLCKVVSAL